MEGTKLLHQCKCRTKDADQQLHDLTTFSSPSSRLSRCHVSLKHRQVSFTEGEKVVLSSLLIDSSDGKTKSTCCPNTIHSQPPFESNRNHDTSTNTSTRTQKSLSSLTLTSSSSSSSTSSLTEQMLFSTPFTDGIDLSYSIKTEPSLEFDKYHIEFNPTESYDYSDGESLLPIDKSATSSNTTKPAFIGKDVAMENQSQSKPLPSKDKNLDNKDQRDDQPIASNLLSYFMNRISPNSMNGSTRPYTPDTPIRPTTPITPSTLREEQETNYNTTLSQAIISEQILREEQEIDLQTRSNTMPFHQAFTRPYTPDTPIRPITSITPSTLREEQETNYNTTLSQAIISEQILREEQEIDLQTRSNTMPFHQALSSKPSMRSLIDRSCSNDSSTSSLFIRANQNTIQSNTDGGASILQTSTTNASELLENQLSSPIDDIDLFHTPDTTNHKGGNVLKSAEANDIMAKEEESTMPIDEKANQIDIIDEEASSLSPITIDHAFHQGNLGGNKYIQNDVDLQVKLLWMNQGHKTESAANLPVERIRNQVGSAQRSIPSQKNMKLRDVLTRPPLGKVNYITTKQQENTGKQKMTCRIAKPPALSNNKRTTTEGMKPLHIACLSGSNEKPSLSKSPLLTKRPTMMSISRNKTTGRDVSPSYTNSLASYNFPNSKNHTALWRAHDKGELSSYLKKKNYKGGRVESEIGMDVDNRDDTSLICGTSKVEAMTCSFKTTEMERSPQLEEEDSLHLSWQKSNESVPRYDCWKILRDEYAQDYGFAATDAETEAIMTKNIVGSDKRYQNHNDRIQEDDPDDGTELHQFKILGTGPDDLSAQPHVLSPPLMDSLINFLPDTLSYENFWLKYSLVRDGSNLETFRSYTRASTNSILAIQTLNGDVFGCFTTSPWENSGNEFNGNGESFVWKMRYNRISSHCHSLYDQAHLESEIDVYPFAGIGDALQLCTNTLLALGGAEANRVSPLGLSYETYQRYTLELDESKRKGTRKSQPGFAISLYDDMSRGSTYPCPTFGSPSLLSDGSEVFDVMNIELWTFTPCSLVLEAQKLEMRKYFIKQKSSSIGQKSTSSELSSKDLVQGEFYRRLGNRSVSNAYSTS